MVFYFTGTGNSLYVAKQLDSEQNSIPQAIHYDELTFESETIGVVCPVYGHEMPDMVKEFLGKATFKTEYFYLVLTYGNIHGGAAELAESALSAIGKKADYINTIKMVDNFLPGFDMNEQIATEPEKKVEEHIFMQVQYSQNIGGFLTWSRYCICFPDNFLYYTRIFNSCPFQACLDDSQTSPQA